MIYFHADSSFCCLRILFFSPGILKQNLKIIYIQEDCNNENIYFMVQEIMTRDF